MQFLQANPILLNDTAFIDALREAVQANPSLLIDLKSLAATNLDPKLQELIAFLEAQQGATETPGQTVSSETPANPHPPQQDSLAMVPL